MNTFKKFASVVLDVAIDKALDYGIPDEFLDSIKPGMQVHVPIRNSKTIGYVLKIKDEADFLPVKAIQSIVIEKELLSPDLFQLARWMAKYYATPLQKIIKTMIPSPVRGNTKFKEQLYVMRKKTKEQLAEFCKSIRLKSPQQADVLDVMLQVKKGILLTELLEKTKGSKSPIETLAKKGYLSLDIVRVDRSPLVEEDYFPTKKKILNIEQQRALENITKALNENKFETHLLYGITGSGKTEVYLQAIDKALSLNQSVIMLVPEIALTTQTIERFRSRFEGKIAILHHRLSKGERLDEWNRIQKGEAQIVIGARSAIFSPIQNLKLIIVDEEHEPSYKQNEEMPCYHARDVAVMRGKFNQAVVILGSATPSLESTYNVKKGKYFLDPLTLRADTAQLPVVKIIDMKKEFEKVKGYTNFSEDLLSGIKKRLELGEKTILFLNRRGYHTTLLCSHCQSSVKCTSCSVSMTFHLNENTLSCHLCGFTLSPPPKKCEKCHSETLKFKGVGTEQIERALHAIFPDIRTLRMDGDTTRHKGSHQSLFKSFATGKADVLIGTQMIAKGLHFPEVTLVAVLNCDSALNFPDFRASETAFQLLTQVSGRAGRGSIKGEVIFQTFMPDNKTIKLAAKQDYDLFYTEEIAVRELFNYPPFSQMVKILFSGKDEKKVETFAKEYRLALKKLLPSNYELHPLIPSGHAKIKDHFRFQFLIKGQSIFLINEAIEKLTIKPSKNIQIKVDVNPISTY